MILTLRLTQNNQWVGVDHAARIQLLNSPPMTDSVEKNKMIVMITMMIETIMANEKGISNEIIKCKSLTRKGGKIYERTHTRHTQHPNKSYRNTNNKK